MVDLRVGDFLARLRTQLRILHALVLREMMTRFGRHNLGFFWLMGEPLILSLGVMLAWSAADHKLGGDVGIVPFVLSGYTMLTLWRHIVGRSVHCFRHNAGLMYHRNVLPIDTLIARALLEVGGTGLAFVIAFIPLYLFGLVDRLYDPLLVVGGWLFLGWFTFGFGLIIAGLSEMNDIVERLIQPIMYITLPLTGMFFMVSWLPEDAARIVLYSPLVHCFELFREGMLGHNVEAQWDLQYLFNCCVCFTAIGFLVIRKARSHISLE
ncbi:ABC-2 type transporter [Rhodomicrobium vannielii ATCC 17100]|uniref:ABC-2 type transporter n=1 Tax=Rhodomicrobium vannielii (strain ATCC 17100 / DSM 162 / LMG 4299 / NCIMB 10020 / ATH 3.1.1) TaxID=648757 RepID=E3I5G5_RHOVT|nr:ABC transporter permease [Rhodomicrobium vannielii]ADP71686.1 ABC-2 type transporter [Rhodomicrobium vannielii ATCC 17100]